MTPFAQPRAGVAPLQLPPLWLIALTLLTLAAVAAWATGQEVPSEQPAASATHHAVTYSADGTSVRKPFLSEPHPGTRWCREPVGEASR